jgi:hypothetical protein
MFARASMDFWGETCGDEAFPWKESSTDVYAIARRSAIGKSLAKWLAPDTEGLVEFTLLGSLCFINAHTPTTAASDL